MEHSLLFSSFSPVLHLAFCLAQWLFRVKKVIPLQAFRVFFSFHLPFFISFYLCRFFTETLRKGHFELKAFIHGRVNFFFDFWEEKFVDSLHIPLAWFILHVQACFVRLFPSIPVDCQKAPSGMKSDNVTSGTKTKFPQVWFWLV